MSNESPHLEADLLGSVAMESLSHYRLLENILDSLGVAVVAWHGNGKIFLVNKEAEFLLGYSRKELRGQPVEILVPDAARDAHPKHRQGYARLPRTRPMGEGLDLHARHKDGELIPVTIALGSFMSDDGVVTTATILRKS